MSYHENVDRNGNVHRQHYNGHRLTPDPLLVNLRKPDDSYEWERRARAALDDLVDKVGQVSYKAWWERSFEFNGQTADNFTWKYIAEAAWFALDHPETLDCGCKLPEESCPICRSIAHIVSVAQGEA